MRKEYKTKDWNITVDGTLLSFYHSFEDILSKENEYSGKNNTLYMLHLEEGADEALIKLLNDVL